MSQNFPWEIYPPHSTPWIGRYPIILCWSCFIRLCKCLVTFLHHLAGNSTKNGKKVTLFISFFLPPRTLPSTLVPLGKYRLNCNADDSGEEKPEHRYYEHAASLLLPQDITVLFWRSFKEDTLYWLNLIGRATG